MKRRILSIIMALTLCVGACPTWALAEESVSNPCTHHRSHTRDCGYKEAEQGLACTHEHAEDCYRIMEGEGGSTTKELDCHHEHDESCGFREETPGSPCTFVCGICNGGTDRIPGDKTDGNGINDGDSENPGTENGDEIEEPGDGQEECICEKQCTEDNGNGGCRINTDCPVCGAEDASLSDCKGEDVEDSTEDAEENTDQPEDTGLCKHHREHDDTCGYLPESEDSEGSPCTYECRICPVEELIAALPDKVTEDNAEDVRAQLNEILALFGELTAEQQEQIDLSHCYELQAALDGSNAPDPITESVEYQEASWDGSQVTYESKTETCTFVENSTEAIEWTVGWYAVSGSVTISEPVTVSGAVNLILTDGCTLNAEKGIVVTTGNSLTIYAQSDGTGTLTATGASVIDGENYIYYYAAAGIGGSTTSLDSGSITIHGGIINATGGVANDDLGNPNLGGAGIGGGSTNNYYVKGGDSGGVTIYGGAITANSGAGNTAGAGIGGGGGMDGGSIGNITIYGGNVTATSHTTDAGSAGIGGGGGSRNGGNGDITINGGIVTVVGGKFAAGIGGGSGGIGSGKSGDGTVTISGGIVTAVGGEYAAGIGGGGGYQFTSSFGSINITGGTGSVTISGGIVDTAGGAGDNNGDYAGAPIGNGGNANGTATVNKTIGIVFENGVGTVCGNVTFNGSYEVPAGYSLHIPAGNSLSGSGTLSGGGTFTTDLSEDMVSLPADLYFNGQDRSNDIKTRLSAGLTKGIAICGQTFTVSGWTVEVEKTGDLTYIVTYTNDSDDTKTFQKTITLQKSGTTLDGAVETYKDGVVCGDFTASDTITVKAMPTVTGEAPTKAAARLGVAPTNGQMAVFVGDIQVSDAANANSDGSYTMTVNASDVLEQGNVEPNGGSVTLTAKFVGNDNMADAAGTVDVKISAVAKVVNGGTTTYVGNLDDAFKAENDGATITLLANVTRTECLLISIDCTLDLGGHTIFGNLGTSDYILVIVRKNVTIQGDGGISGTGDAQVLQTSGNVIIKGGTFSCVSGNCIFVTGSNASLSITGSEVRVESTGGYGLCIGIASSVQLSAGTYSGEAGAIFIDYNNSFTLGDLLGHTDTTRYAYYKNDTTLVAEGLDSKTLADGSYTVRACEHIYEYTHTKGTTTHQQTCLACGKKWDEENCSFDEDGKCACGAVLAVTLPDNLNLTYTGTAQTPAVTVTVDGTELAANHYTATYANNTNAGTAMVTVTGETYTGKVTKEFTIQQATPTLAWESTTQELTYTGKEARITAPKATGPNDIQLGITNDTGPCRFSYAAQGDSMFTDGLPTDVGTYTIKASVEAKGNYTAADSTNTLKLTINKAPGMLTVPEIQISRKYGDASFSLNCSTNGDGRISYKSSNEDVASVSADGTVLITGAGTAVITVSLGEGSNYSAAGDKTITVNVDKKDGYTVEALSRSYLYSRENKDSIDLAVLLPKDCGTVAYGSPQYRKDWVYSTAPAVTDGKLSYTLGTGNINDEDSITVTVTTRNYADITITIKVKLTDRIPVELKEGTEVTLAGNTLTYGESLSKLEFNNAVFVDGDGNTVEGALTWKDAAARPDAGTTSAVWVFTPADQTYASVEGTAAITVNRAVPAVSAAPTVAGRVYNPLRVLGKSDLSGGTAGGVDGMELAGEWSWQSADIVPTVNNSGYVAVFTPTDITNYETVTRTITVTVEKAMPYIAVIPAAAGLTYGETLKDSTLTGGNVQYGNGAGQPGNGDGSTTAVSGTFTWKESSVKPAVADSNMTEYTVIFTPSDTADYHSVETKVKLTVNKAQNAPNMPGSAMDVSNSIEKAGDIPLPEGWEWQASDKDTALEVGVAVNAVAVYTGADKGNYEKETVTVAITRSACDHTAGDVLYTGAGERAPTCRSDGIGHRECTKCGIVTESGIVVKALGHTGGTATCSSRAVCTRCGQPYGDTAGNIHGSTEVRGSRAATCTAGGYTGDAYCKDCGAKTKAGSATPALGHNYTDVVAKEPTTDNEGIRTYTCSRCGHSYTESIPRLPEETHYHSYTGSVAKQPTCTDTGVRIHACSCGDSYTETIAALGHHYQSSETRKPTATAEGVMTYTCDRCGHSYTRPIAKLPGEDTTDPGTSQPGETEPGAGNAEETRPEPGRPFIKGEDGKTGWDVIRAEEEQAEEGGAINVDMNGSTVVPGDIFDSIKGRDITITFDMGSGILWSVDGKSITTDKAGDIDFSVKKGVNTIPVDIVNNVTGERYSVQISLAYEGEFGFTAVLSINLGKENAGYAASLYYYNESTGELEFICADEVSADGTVSLAFTHASDYVIAIDGEQEEESDDAESVQPEAPDTDGTGATEESPQAGQAWRPWWIVVVGLLVIVIGIGVFFVVKKKQETDS